MRTLLTLLLAVAIAPLFSQQLTPPSVTFDTFATSLARPVGIYNSGIAGDERLFILEQHTGKIKIYNLGGTYLGDFLDLSGLATFDEQGLLGMAFSPNYATDGFFYLNYTPSGGDTRISRFSVSGNANVADASSEEILMTIIQDFGNHNGGHIAFGPDGYLYIGMGDGGSGGDPNDRAQNINSLLGKMLRIDVSGTTEYTIPGDNPYVGIAGQDEIWAIGLRNPWKFSFDSETGNLWIGDVGQNQREEIDLLPAGTGNGANLGWRCYEGFNPFNTDDCPATGFTDPLADYTHGSPDNFCSITGGIVYHGSSASLDGHYIFTDYCDGRIYSLKDDGTGNYDEFTLRNIGGFGNTAFGVDIYGDMYMGNLISGSVFKLSDPCGGFEPTISAEGGTNAVEVSDGIAFEWYVNGELVDGETSSTFTPTSFGSQSIYAIVTDATGCVFQTQSLDWVVVGGVEGCTYPTATNYTEGATVDDGSCVFILEPGCSEDINGDGAINSGDLILLLGSFGGTCS